MTAKKIVVHTGKTHPGIQGEVEPGKQKGTAGVAKPTAKTDIGLDRALPGEKAAASGRRSGAGSARGTGEAPAHPKPSRPGKPTSAKPVKPIVLGSSPAARSKEFRFLCNACGKKLQAPETMAGQTTRCPDCGNAITVPQPTAEALTSKQQKRGVRYKKPKTFKFFCVRCGQSLEADRALGETQTECPHCRSVIVVPLPADG